MTNAPTAKARRKLEGDAMRREMQNMIFSFAPVNTLFRAFLDAIAMYGRKTALVKDMRKVEKTYGQLLKKFGARQTCQQNEQAT